MGDTKRSKSSLNQKLKNFLTKMKEKKREHCEKN